MNNDPQRLQKVLAQRGIGSRREIEAWIAAGQIEVNGQTAVLGTKVTDADRITVQGRLVPVGVEEHRFILYNKPEGLICTRSDPQGRITVFSKLPQLNKLRWVSIGRLDINSSGLILFTTDGELANALMHPKANIEREYAVRVLGTVTQPMIQRMLRGVTLEDGTKAKFTQIKAAGGTGANVWYHITLMQGRYREVRRVFETQGLRVSRLIRIRYGPFVLPKDLSEGKFLELDYDKYKTAFNQP
ncbi:MAG TPA: pseudouridine synthase [Gammaproteobacteria bacterium]|nr:pseudouridine synthase [Gammaproteobacteria bacterium]